MYECIWQQLYPCLHIISICVVQSYTSFQNRFELKCETGRSTAIINYVYVVVNFLPGRKKLLFSGGEVL